MDIFAQAKKFKDVVTNISKNAISNELSMCVKRKRVTVKRKANGETIGVSEAYGVEFPVPYHPSLENVEIGTVVLIEWEGSFSNARAVSLGNGFLPS